MRDEEEKITMKEKNLAEVVEKSADKNQTKSVPNSLAKTEPEAKDKVRSLSASCLGLQLLLLSPPTHLPTYPKKRKNQSPRREFCIVDRQALERGMYVQRRSLLRRCSSIPLSMRSQ